jgi:rod shape-determining protein MreC
VTPDGIVGKVREVFGHTAQVLEINDQTSGAGVVLETTRIRGILRGNAAGQPQVINILADSRIQPGEKVLTAGGDQIFPRGLPVGVVEKVTRDNERSGFIEVAVKPAANLQLLDEVLVITSMDAHLSPKEQADLATSEDLKGAEVAAEAERKKAAAEMAERLPGLKDASAPDAKTADASNPNDPKAADKPAPPQTVPKPLPAKHPDRFSPGAPPEAVPDFDSPNAKPITQPAEPKADAPAAQPKTGASSAPKTAAPKSTTGTAPKTGPGHAGPGHAGPGRMR